MKQSELGEAKKAESKPHVPLSYNSYLKIDELMQLQVCRSDSPHHDEPLFIIIHQTYELWFKLILHEIDTVTSLINMNQIRRAIFYMRRITTIAKILVQQIHILETMSPKEFLEFRYHLNPASGFQSSQFREIEFAGGLRDKQLLEHFRFDDNAYKNLEKRYHAASLQDTFYALLSREGFHLPPDPVNSRDESSEAIENIRINELIKIYNHQEKFAEIYDLAETLIDFDEQIFLWRTHHMQVVERVIGFKRGTGGSEGVDYLRSTLNKRFFPDLWKLRTCLLDKDI